MNILELIYKASPIDRISRKELMIKTNMSDRNIRTTIHNLRRKGYRICSDTKNYGYYIGTEKEWDKFVSQQRKRALNNMYPMSNELDGQLEILFVKGE
jgi:biotin operon repressor